MKVFRKNYVMTQADMIEKIHAKTMPLGEKLFRGQSRLRIIPLVRKRVRPISLTHDDRKLLVRELLLEKIMKRAYVSKTTGYNHRTCAVTNEISGKQGAVHYR